MVDPIELRRAMRKRVGFPIIVVDTINGEPLGQLCNISSTGMMLISPQPPRGKAIYQVSVPLPRGENPTHLIYIGVQEQWHAPVIETDQTLAGFRIIAISDADLATLDAWLKRAD